MWDSARRHLREQLRLERGLPSLPGESVCGPIPLSATQMRMWHRELTTADGRFANNVAAPVVLLGVLDRPALEYAVERVVRRHNALRTAFEETPEGPRQRVRTVGGGGRITYEDLSGGSPEMVDRRLAATVTERFDLTAGVPFRVVVFRRRPDDHIMLVVGHHLVLDGRSLSVILVEVARCYTEYLDGGPVRDDRPIVQLDQFVRWQGDWMRSAAAVPYERYWRSVLADPAFRRFGAHPFRRPSADDHSGGRVVCRVSAEVAARVDGFAAAEGVSSISVYLAAYQAVMEGCLGQRYVVVGIPAVNRGRAELADMVGLLANVLPVAVVEPASRTLRSAVCLAERSVAAAYVHQAMPIEHMTPREMPLLDPAESPIDTFFAAYRQAVPEPVLMTGLELGPWPQLRAKDTETPVMMTVFIDDDGADVRLGYGEWALSESAAHDLLAVYTALMDAGTRRPDVTLASLLGTVGAP
ncbi:condensation domain-containing protein [Actinoplanes rectilineatus]|uniref:condensation domain-containing protein n=1 Tax=Actinoplanes rectilineatus TaxID=113571 RepID=UPI0005F2C891|nr:condensation domain-containing protein [Actinoplanes rectilineatus]